MLCTAASTTPLRTAALTSLRFPLHHSAATTARPGVCGYSTAAPTSVAQKKRGYLAHARRRGAGMPESSLSASGRFVLLNHRDHQRRNNSTIATATPQNPTAAARSAAPLPAASPQDAPLTWNTFLLLRRRRRHYNVASSILSSISSTILGVSYLSQQDIDALSSQLYGLDPFMVLGLATVGFGVVGWLAGPVLGGWAFSLVRGGGGVGRQMAEKEKEFFDRIRRHRVDPSSQSFSNPVPDYYGEKIGSVQQYRQWLKDQRAYNKKRQSFL
ncbi:hypothetical protein FGG08_006108 [Glutinoglossum americanum]|uniref:Presequence translocated-associated motor subunit PAM17 n=1 Tax=Glutinoglossum americanum TaxID=1670608 RepID=A0A9P8L297_9PEZI|nr:hypothetical protein FGG08_006108 [Glutinoglossum americanum]